MTRKINGIVLESDVWADDGEKISPSFPAKNGWDIRYSEAGGLPVERKLFNYNFNQVTSLCYDVNRFGSNLPYNELISYETNSLVIGSNGIRYISKVPCLDQDPVLDTSFLKWRNAETTTVGDGTNILTTTSGDGNKVLNLSQNLSSKANKSLDNVTVGDFLGKFQNNSSITWDYYNSKITGSINLTSKADKDLSNVSAASLKGKFKDNSSITWSNSNDQVSGIINLTTKADKNLSNVSIGDYPKATQAGTGIIGVSSQSNVDRGIGTTEAVCPAALKSLLLKIVEPIGTIIHYYGTVPPVNYLAVNGYKWLKTTYSDLFAVIGSRQNVSTDATQFWIADARSRFIRGVDGTNILGFLQGDATRKIEGTFKGNGLFNRDPGIVAAGPFSSYASGLNNTAKGEGGSGRGIKFDSSLAVPTAYENRPVNVSYLICIKYQTGIL